MFDLSPLLKQAVELDNNDYYEVFDYGGTMDLNLPLQVNPDISKIVVGNAPKRPASPVPAASNTRKKVKRSHVNKGSTEINRFSKTDTSLLQRTSAP